MLGARGKVHPPQALDHEGADLHQSSHCQRWGSNGFRFSDGVDPYLSSTHVQALALRPISNQLSRAKLTLSAQFKPKLRPAWYPCGKVITNSPACWTRKLGRHESFASMLGEARNDLCRKNCGQADVSRGKRTASTSAPNLEP